MVYLQQHSGDPPVIMATLNSYYTTPLRQPNLGIDIAKFTPITKMADDTFQLWVSTETTIKTVDDYVKAVKSAGAANWKMGGTGSGQEDFLVTAILEKKFGKIPTFEELGYGKDMVYYMQRSVIAPAGIDKDVQAFYVGVFDKVYKSEEWQGYMKSKGLIPGWLTGDALTAYFLEGRKVHEGLLKASGELK